MSSPEHYAKGKVLKYEVVRKIFNKWLSFTVLVLYRYITKNCGRANASGPSVLLTDGLVAKSRPIAEGRTRTDDGCPIELQSITLTTRSPQQAKFIVLPQFPLG